MSFPRYKQYKDSGVEWLGEVPEHWKLGKLHHIAILNPAKAELGDIDPQTTISFLPMEAFDTKGDPSLSLERTIGQVETGYTYFRDGDVAFAKVTPCFENGKRAIFSKLTNGVGFGTTELIVLRARHRQTIPKFLYWFVATSEFLGLGEGSMYGAGGLKRVPESFVHQFPVWVPSTDEQNSIVAFLDQEMAKIDALIEEQRRLIELLKDKRQAVISHAVTKGLNPNVQMKDSRIDWVGDVPHHWTVVPVAYRYDVQLGKMLDTLKITGENLRPYLRVVDVQWDSINVDDLPLMDFDEDARCKFRLRAGDLLINEGGSYPGRTAIWSSDLECYYQKALHRLRPRAADTDHPRYFFYLMFWALHTGVFTAGGNEATIEHLPAEKLRRYRFAFPQYEEQSGIAEFLDEQTSQFNSLISAAQRAVDLFQERRSALISSAVTGKIDVRNYTPKEAA